jgi:hypothetical protein
MRSAKMNAITPPKLMPPFQSTAASGIFPTEQTNEMTATSGPTIGPHSLTAEFSDGGERRSGGYRDALSDRAAPCRSAVALPVGATSNASSSESRLCSGHMLKIG